MGWQRCIMASAAYAALDKAWRATCRVLLGQEACPLSKCEDWLKEYMDGPFSRTSAVSKKPVYFSMDDYSPGAKYLSFEEADLTKKFEPLSINDMKDMDSVAEAVQERTFYTGNIVLGHSSFIEGSCNVHDSHFVLGSSGVVDSKYVAFSRHVRGSEYVFGQHGADKDIHLVKCTGAEMKRCMECHMAEVLSDCYYCGKVQNCIECMFCFGAENISHAIGNTRLPKDKYYSLKKKLLSDIADELSANGRVFSLLELLEKAGAHKKDARLKFGKEQEPPFDISPIERAFQNTTRLLVGRKLEGIDNYADYLYRHVPIDMPSKSALSGNRVLSCGYRLHMFKLYDFEGRLATDNELREIGKIGVGEEAVSKMGFSLDSAAEALHPVAYFNLDKVAGKNSNYKDCTVLINSQDVYKGSAFTWDKKCAYGFWPSVSEAVFGVVLLFESSFSMNSYYSKKLTRCMEVDNCETCSDLYFSHNCENVRDSMFCFNTKNRHHSIGNAELPPETYKKVKSSLVAQMADELEKKKTLKWDIFTVGAQAGQ